MSTALVVRPDSHVGILRHARQTLDGVGVKYSRISLVGSKFILGPDKGEDTDILIEVDDLDDASDALCNAGFEKGGSESVNEFWRSCLRKFDMLNVLLTDDPAYFDKWVQAAEVCRYLQLEEKDARVAVHMIVMDGYKAFHFKFGLLSDVG